MDATYASVLVIESHPLLREALCAAISDEPDLRVGMQAASGAEALQMFRIILPDIILFAVGKPELDNLNALRTLRQSLPETPILALTSNEVPGQEQRVLEAGAGAVLTKSASRAELIGKLREFWMEILVDHSPVNVKKEADENISPS